MWARICAVAAVVVALFLARPASAQDKPTLAGTWTASALTESWSVVEWGEACGPRPAPQGAGGGSVQVREQGGELSIVGAGRAFSTAECWEQMPGVARSSHSQSGGGRAWRTRCTSPANDSRRTAITTSISATDTTIALSEIGDYVFTIKDTNCHATVSRSRSFSLVRRDGDVAPATASAPPPPPPAPTHEPRTPPPSRCQGASGDPARLEVKPAKKLLRAGDRFAFRALVLDADGCNAGARPTWAITGGPGAAKASVDATGAVSVEADAAEGTLEVTATVGGKGVTVLLDVASPEHFDAMLAASGLDDAGEADQAAVAVIASGTIGGRTAAADDAGRERKTTFVAIVVGIAAVLAFAGLVIVRRGKNPVEIPAEEGPSSIPPLSRRRVEEAAPVAPPEPPALPATKPRGKICPNCGERYANEATFCGTDGTVLVLIN